MANLRQVSEQNAVSVLHAEVTSSNPVVSLERNTVYPILTDPSQKQAVENFGVLRTRLLDARAKSGMRAILLSSPQQQEGKSFTCLNLAISFAQLRYEPILLIDGDLRVQGITRALGLDKKIGLCDFLQDRAGFEDCIRPTNLPYLHLAAAGNVDEDDLPSALEGSKWPTFVRRAKQEYGLVIVDSVPVSAPIADFELLLSASDAVLLVVFLRKTSKEALDIATQKAQGKLLGVVVNNTQCEVSSNYYSYYMRTKPTKR